MEGIAQVAAAAQEEIGDDLGSLFRGAIRLMLECLLEQEVMEMVAPDATSVWATARTTSTGRTCGAS